jgi:hypothetical protein
MYKQLSEKSSMLPAIGIAIAHVIQNSLEQQISNHSYIGYYLHMMSNIISM